MAHPLSVLPWPQCSAVWPLSSFHKITPEVQLRACCSSKRRSGVGTTTVDVKSHVRHAPHHLLAVHRLSVGLLGCCWYSPSSLSTCPPQLPACASSSRGVDDEPPQMAADTSEHSRLDFFAKVRHQGDELLGLGCSFDHAAEYGLARQRHDLLT